MRNPFGSVHQFVLFDELVPEKSLRESLQREPLAFASAHRDTFRAELALAFTLPETSGFLSENRLAAGAAAP